MKIKKIVKFAQKLQKRAIDAGAYSFSVSCRDCVGISFQPTEESDMLSLFLYEDDTDALPYEYYAMRGAVACLERRNSVSPGENEEESDID